MIFGFVVVTKSNIVSKTPKTPKTLGTPPCYDTYSYQFARKSVLSIEGSSGPGEWNTVTPVDLNLFK